MSRVDFYVLSEESPDARLRYACRLAEQAVEQGQRVYLQTSNSSDAQRLDELLWTFNDRSFLPHEIYSGSAASHPLVMILLGDSPAPASHRQLVVNLTEAVPDRTSRPTSASPKSSTSIPSASAPHASATGNIANAVARSSTTKL